MRTKSFLKNGLTILLVQIFNAIMDFLNRTAIIYTLSMDYVGIKGFCTNILSILSLTELGISTILIYSMYRPLAEHDNNKLLALIGYYRKAYCVIAGVIALSGLLITPFLPFLVKDCPDIKGLYIIFLLYLANSVFSYLFTYNISVLDADQKIYIRTIWHFVFHNVRNIAQIAILFLTGSFIFYLVIQIPLTLTENLFLSARAKKDYPFLKTKKYPPLQKEDIISLKKNTFAMFSNKIGATVLNTTDNMIISRFIGLAAVAINDNYVLIVNTITQVMDQILFALITGVGNLNVTAPKNTLYKVFKKLHFANFWFYCFSTSCLLLLLNPFIELIWGRQYLFSMPVVTFICFNFFIRGIRNIPIVFRDSMGLIWHYRYKPIVESCINIIVSIIAVYYFGAAGVFAGTFFSMICTSLWIEPYVVFKYGLKMSWKEFWLTNAKYIIIFMIIMPFTYFVGTLYNGILLYKFIFRLVIGITIPNLIMFILFCRSEQFKELLAVVNFKREA